MTHWNYRVVKEKEAHGGFHYSIRDVYYSKKNKPHSWGAEPQHPISDTKGGLLDDIRRMKRAFDKPTLLVQNDKLIEIKKKKV